MGAALEKHGGICAGNNTNTGRSEAADVNA
jgi:hypothetical protein